MVFLYSSVFFETNMMDEEDFVGKIVEQTTEDGETEYFIDRGDGQLQPIGAGMFSLFY